MNNYESYAIIEKNLAIIRENITKSLINAGRDGERITLVAASKTRSIGELLAAAALGVDAFGENTAQELMSKFGSITEKIDIHFIGQLQTNKVKYVIDKVTLIQSLDREQLAQKIQASCERTGAVMDALIEINITEEEKRGGIPFPRLLDFFEMLEHLPNIRTRGLMCVAPLGGDTRSAFRRARAAFDDIRRIYGKQSFDILSMGMSDDYMIAVEEGSTMVRLGNALFGKRL